MAKVANFRDRKTKLITKKEDIPASFESEEAEVEWWETHELTPELLLSLPEPSQEELKERFSQVERQLVTRQADLPDFSKMSRAEEAEWWETHDIARHLMDTSPEGIDQARAQTYAALGIDDPAKNRH